nr:tremerogena13 [Tremella mesenterica]
MDAFTISSPTPVNEETIIVFGPVNEEGGGNRGDPSGVCVIA